MALQRNGSRPVSSGGGNKRHLSGKKQGISGKIWIERTHLSVKKKQEEEKGGSELDRKRTKG